MTLTLSIPAPCEAINANQRLHRMVKARRTAAWREAATVAAQATWDSAYLDHAHVRAVCHFPDKRRRDAGNWYPTAKAILDGLVDYGLLDDDSDAYVVGPDMRAGERADRFGMTITLDPDCACLDCAHRFGPRLALITNGGPK